MTLEVPYEGFVEAVRKLAPGLPAFALGENGGTRLSAADPARSLRVVTFAPETPAAVAERLRADGLTVREGRWVPDDAPPTEGRLHVAAVAYRTETLQPGLWVDAFSEAPTANQALRALFDEFRASGEVADVSFEEFMRLAEPTVVVVGPDELRGFAAAKDC